MHEEPLHSVCLKFIPSCIVSIGNGSSIDQFLHVQAGERKQRHLEVPQVRHEALLAFRLGRVASGFFVAFAAAAGDL